MAVGNWSLPHGAEKVKPFLDKNGEFKPPTRKFGEDYWKWQGRVKAARKIYSQHKNILSAHGVGPRHEIRQHKLKIKEIQDLKTKINKYANVDEANEYGASLSIKSLGNRLNRLEGQLNIPKTKIPRNPSEFSQFKVSGGLEKTLDRRMMSSTANLGSNYKEEEAALFKAAGDEEQLPGSDANEALKIKNRNAKGRVLSPKFQAGDAVGSRNNDKAPAPQTVQALLKSDVFTLDEDGNALGVMTRSQRRNWDAANQDLMRKRQNELKIADRSYYNRGELLRIGSG